MGPLTGDFGLDEIRAVATTPAAPAVRGGLGPLGASSLFGPRSPRQGASGLQEARGPWSPRGPKRLEAPREARGP